MNLRNQLLFILSFLVIFALGLVFAGDSDAAYPGDCTYVSITVGSPHEWTTAGIENAGYLTVVDLIAGTVTSNASNGYWGIETGEYYYTNVGWNLWYWDNGQWNARAGVNTQRHEDVTPIEFPTVTNPSGCPAPPEPCQDEMQAALDSCGGDPEKVQVFNIDTCDIRCTPCVTDPDVKIWEHPEKWEGISLADAITKCGSFQNVSYAVDSCTSTCQNDACDEQYNTLASECGGTENIQTWSEDTCSGTCYPCSQEIKAANIECGTGLYTLETDCSYTCNSCDDKWNDCVTQCGGADKIWNYSCNSTTGLNVSCECKDTPDGVDPFVPPTLTDPSIAKKTTVKSNPDGTTTKVSVLTSTDKATGDTITETTTVNYDMTGAVISTNVSTETSTAIAPDGTEEGATEELPVIEVLTLKEIDLTPITATYQSMLGKVPFSTIDNISNVMASMSVPAVTPAFDLPLGAFGDIHISFSGMDSFASTMRSIIGFLFKIATVIACIMIFKGS